MSRNKIPVIVIAGPTSSGKSDLAIQLARRFDGEIISADSRQVYQGMDIGTGKVTTTEQKMVRHWLLDVASPKRQYTVAQWKKAAQSAIADITRRGKIPIICGGTGFWIDALVYNQNLPEVKPNTKLRAKLGKLSAEQLFAKLLKLDPRRAHNIDPHNPRRLIRAVEIVLTTGEPVPTTGMIYHTSPSDVLYLAITRPFPELKKRITQRLDIRLTQGMITEIKRLRASGISWKRLESFGLEYRWVSRFLQKKISRTDMGNTLLHDIVGYSKRQLTWLRRNNNVIWITRPTQAKHLVKKWLKA